MIFFTPLRLLCAVAVVFASCSGGGGNDRASGGSSATFRTMAAHWNHVAIDASGFDHATVKEQLGPSKAARAEAIVHIAMYDAANAIYGQKYEPFLLQDTAEGASVEAAIAQAAHDTLSSVFPSQAAHFADQLQEDLAGIEDGEAKTRGVQIGAKAAALILANRANDGVSELTNDAPYNFSKEPGKWRSDPTVSAHSGFALDYNYAKKVRPFVIRNASQFRAPPPPSLKSTAYAESYAEVFQLGGDGINTPTLRTEDQTEAGIFWAYDGTPTLCAPPRLYNQVAMEIASQQGIVDNLEILRLLAQLNVAMADAGITSWETKYYYNFWRPITAIREADAGTGPTGKGDGNPQTIGDPSFLPLGAPASNTTGVNFTPPFPAYVSGHATFGGALFQVLRNYFGTDDIAFTFVSDEFDGQTKDNEGNIRPLRPRSFSSLSQAEEENGQSRIYLGIHFSFDKTEGIKMGRKVADYVTSHAFRRKK